MNLKIYETVDGKYDLQNDGTAIYDIQYDNKSKKNTFDLYVPTIRKEKYPVIIYVHGGGLFKSDKSRHISNCLNGLLYGYAVASVNYRLNDEACYEEIRTDVLNAINTISKMEQIDSDKIIVWAESHGALMLCDLVVNYRSQLNAIPKCVLSYYAPIDLYDYYLHKEKNNEHVYVNGNEIDSLSFRTTGNELLEKLKNVNILDHIQGNEPPFFLLHGCKDTAIPMKYTEWFDQVLTNKNVKHETHFIENGIHGIDCYGIPEINSMAFNFIEACL